MAIRTVHVSLDAPDACAASLAEQLAGFSPNFVVYFASSQLDFAQLSAAIQERLGTTPTLGCTTAGEIGAGKMLKGSVVAMAFDSETLADVCVGVVDDLVAPESLKTALAGFEAHAGRSMRELPFEKYVGLVLVDGLSVAEETLMDRLGNHTDILFVGGSAGDDLKFEKTLVACNGKVHSQAAALALLQPRHGFDVLKTQSFVDTGKTLEATKVDEARRMIHEFDGQPALCAYAEAVGVDPGLAETKFMSHTLGLVVDGDPYVRSLQKSDGRSLQAYCQVKAGMELHLLESGDIVADTAESFQTRVAELGGVAGALNFHCILRTLDLEAKGQTEAYGRIFAEVPTVGFSTYGEECLGHINQTSVLLLFK